MQQEEDAESQEVSAEPLSAVLAKGHVINRIITKNLRNLRGFKLKEDIRETLSLKTRNRNVEKHLRLICICHRRKYGRLVDYEREHKYDGNAPGDVFGIIVNCRTYEIIAFGELDAIAAAML